MVVRPSHTCFTSSRYVILKKQQIRRRHVSYQVSKIAEHSTEQADQNLFCLIN
jgi:hypothetical protein